MTEKINLVTSFFVSKLSDTNISLRNNELVEALKKNVESPYIESIHLFVDDENSHNRLKELFNDYIINGKIVIASLCKGMPLYYDLFNYAINNLKDKICMVSNSDIYIHECDMRLLTVLTENSLYALTRHEYNMSCPLINDYHGSHDSFIFKSPLNVSLEEFKFPQNVWGSEAKLLGLLYNQGVTIKNPCKQIKIVHLHKSNIREKNRPWVAYHTPQNKAVNHPPLHIDI
jgi:hypothetical protein